MLSETTLSEPAVTEDRPPLFWKKLCLGCQTSLLAHTYVYSYPHNSWKISLQYFFADINLDEDSDVEMMSLRQWCRSAEAKDYSQSGTICDIHDFGLIFAGRCTVWGNRATTWEHFQVRPKSWKSYIVSGVLRIWYSICR